MGYKRKTFKQINLANSYNMTTNWSKSKSATKSKTVPTM
jgi:hypothetical protein